MGSWHSGLLAALHQLVHKVERQPEDENEEQGGEYVEIQPQVESTCFISCIGSKLPPVVGGCRIPGDGRCGVEVHEPTPGHGCGIASIAGGEVIFICQGAFAYAVVIAAKLIGCKGAVKHGVGILEKSETLCGILLYAFAENEHRAGFYSGICMALLSCCSVGIECFIMLSFLL